MSSRYPVSSNFLLTEYIWRGEADRFPNAKLFDGGSDADSAFMSLYCEECQLLYDDWANQNRRDGGFT
jgi:hypothetical protein